MPHFEGIVNTVSRYGDPISADADLVAMSTMRSFLKPDGVAIIAVPVCFQPTAMTANPNCVCKTCSQQVGADAVVWNVHRIYGAIRLPLLLEGWSILACAGFEDVTLIPGEYNGPQPVMVLAPANSEKGFSSNLPQPVCIKQLQQLGLCDLE